MIKNFKKGFTLIELLVVIAIIGILSSIVLASLSSARTKGEDAAIETSLSNMRAQAELYYSNNNSYGPAVANATCPTASAATNIFSTTTTGGLWTLVDAVDQRSAAVNCGTNGTAWAVSARLKSDETKYWCVDSAGASKQTSGALAAATYVCS